MLCVYCVVQVVQVSVGDGSCYAVTDAGEVYAWGQGAKGQLGTGEITSG